jgi:hypothetical protein
MRRHVDILYFEFACVQECEMYFDKDEVDLVMIDDHLPLVVFLKYK